MKRYQKAVSTSLAIVLLIVGLVVGVVAGYAASSTVSPSKSSSSSPDYVSGCTNNKCTIGDLVALSGDLASYGANSKVAVNMAITDINSWLNASGSSIQFQADHEDTQTLPATALTDLTSMFAAGIQVFVGPMTSAEVENVVTYANSNHIVLISQSSTAQALASRSISSTYLFRFVPSDNAQSAALAALVWQRGIKSVEVVSRNDAWGTGLSGAFITDFQNLGGKVVDNVQYTPSTGTYDFTPQLSKMESDLSGAANGTAVVAVMFDEMSVMMQQASSSASTYPMIGKAGWFGTDGTTESTTVVTQAPASFSENVKLLSTIYEPTNSSKNVAFTNEFFSQTGRFPDAYAYAAYDATWVAALSVIACGKYSGVCVQSEVPKIASNYFGVSGYPDLNAAGDRAISDYAIWAIVANSTSTTSAAEWEQVGTWSSSTGEVSYTVTI
jgi:branched-chain amino acid transport system substrate-binding protein